MLPEWFTTLSIAMLGIGAVCSLWIAADVLRRPQHMWVMNIVWPVTALFAGPLAVWMYYSYGRLATHARVEAAKARDETPPHKRHTPFPMIVAKGATHCGSGCTLGDICAEFLALGAPVVATWVGWKTLFPDTHHGKIFAVWVLDYIFAFAFGVVFQYFTIKPMRDLSVGKGIVQAVKADALSLTSWQLGMYGMMAIFHFLLFAQVWNVQVKPSSPAFWFAMQVAMLAGFATAYPVNWWLIRKGIKEKM